MLLDSTFKVDALDALDALRVRQWPRPTKTTCGKAGLLIVHSYVLAH
jgi:hypothetical protein